MAGSIVLHISDNVISRNQEKGTRPCSFGNENGGPRWHQSMHYSGRLPFVNVSHIADRTQLRHEYDRGCISSHGQSVTTGKHLGCVNKSLDILCTQRSPIRTGTCFFEGETNKQKNGCTVPLPSACYAITLGEDHRLWECPPLKCGGKRHIQSHNQSITATL